MTSPGRMPQMYSTRAMVRPFISHSIGPYMVGRGLPVVPPQVCTLVGMDLQPLAHRDR